jgi:hypothetical protein
VKAAPKMKVGAEPKKVAILAVLSVIAVVVFFINDSSPSNPGRQSSASQSHSATPVPTAPVTASRAPDLRRDARPIPGVSRGRATRDFHPTLKPDKEDAVDYTKIDPTLRLDLLAKLQKVEIGQDLRSLFDFGTAPPPTAAEIAKNVKPIKPGPLPPPHSAGPAATGDPPKPPPPPIPLKFYGFVSPKVQGPRRAFFLEGDDIFVAAEGDTIKNRYKVIRIGVNSAVVEDTTNKNQQTLKLVEEAIG